MTRFFCRWMPLLAIMPLLAGCFTGIESTKQIEISKQERKLLLPSPEERLMEPVAGTPLQLWSPGRQFAVADSKLSILLQYVDGQPNQPLRPGEILRFVRFEPLTMPDGKDVCAIIFKTHDNNLLRLNTGKDFSVAPREVTSDKLTLLWDMEMIEKADSILNGKVFWNRTEMVYTNDTTRSSILKYSPLQIDSVRVGNAYFPMKVWSHSQDNSPFFLFMDFNLSSAESRPFAKLMSLSDPRQKYPGISDEHWELIRAGKVTVGMTKEECRLSMGNPMDATSGRDYSSTYDIWQYQDGSFLRFVDGLLSDFRHS